MEFKKYNSIENSYRKAEIEKAELQFPGEKYYVEEKIHGANFSFHYEGDGVKCAKRTSFLEEGESFYSWEVVYDRHADKIRELGNKLFEERGIESVIIYGELYGGCYPHKDAPKLNVKKVQDKIYYSNDVHFVAFDMKLDGEYVDYYTLKSICDAFNIPRLDTLMIGTLEECLKYPNEFPTMEPTRKTVNLPEIEDNICEGTVIKTLYPKYFGNGKRVIFKNKNEKWSEKQKLKHKTTHVPVDISHVQHLINEGLTYITENRLRNVLSKHGEFTQKDFGRVMGALSKDAIEDFEKDNEEFLNMDKVDRKLVTKKLNHESGNLIRRNILNILDGEF